MNILFKSDFKNLKLLNRGKVREVYAVEDKILFFTSDRISAFDVIMDQPIPNKGIILSEISAFWFEKTKHIVDNHFITNDVREYPEICQEYKNELEGRSMLVKKCTTLPIECIVRGYVAGSGWKDYKKSGKICGIEVPAGLKEFEKLPEPIFTPSTKAAEGHDENISFEEACKIIGEKKAKYIKKYAVELYKFAAEFLYKKGIILADTKFEFGEDTNNNIILIDEALTPDSSRFWLLEEYAPGKPQMNFDKQVLRDYLEQINWDKTPPPPHLPDDIIQKTSEKYEIARKRIIG